MSSSTLAPHDAPPASVPIVHLGRRFRFSAMHRLHVGTLSDERNAELFGKCNNPFGHGHNYVVELTFTGPMDTRTGMVVDLSALDSFAHAALAEFDCADLNTLPAFAATVPSTEHLCLELWRRFRVFPHATLHRVRVEETGNNAFEYSGERA